MRLVLDTNVVVSALLWKCKPRRLLRAVAFGGFELVTSDPLLAELADVLSRGKFKKKISLLVSHRGNYLIVMQELLRSLSLCGSRAQRQTPMTML